nr:MAG TPA: Protein recA [Caudoviricetes sp.]
MSNLDLIIKDLNKKMKVGNIQLGVDFQEVQKIPFSSCRLNYMTYGGIPVGRIAEFYGADGSGKTTTAIDVAGNAQKMFPDKKVLFVDIEHTFDPCWATKLGLNCDDIIYLDPDSMGAEDVFNIVKELIESGEISICIMDSIGAMVSMQANEKQIGERTYGGISMPLTEFANKIAPVLSRTNCVLIGINQSRDDMNSPYGGLTTPGGRAWRHSCSTRLEFRKGNYIDEKGSNLSRACENPAGNIVNVALVKSKVCRPDRKVGFYTLKYLEGIDYVSDAVDVAIKMGLVVQEHAWFSLVDIETGEILSKYQGKSKLVEYLKENDNYKDFYSKLEKLLNEE